MVFSNIVRRDELRKIQSKALKEIADALLCSFGPMGSNSIIIKDNARNRYTKDGYSILKEIKLSGAIEHSITEDLVDITRDIVKEFGDNSTSAILAAQLLFEEFIKLEEVAGELPFAIIENFKKAAACVSNEIIKHGHTCNLEDIYRIAFTSTNGNAKLANSITSIYTNFGMDVFIDVTTSNTGDDQIKEYDGLTIDSGYSDTAYINNKIKGVCSLRNPSIYVFEDPIDTPEMMSMFDAIIAHNIMQPLSPEGNPNGELEVRPTVIMATTISRDLSAYMEQLINFMYNQPEANRPPLLIINDIYQRDQFMDIARLCGARLICKYIDPKQQAKAIADGLAATPLTVHTFGGSAELVEASVAKTKFVNPRDMLDDKGNPATAYTSLVDWLESNIKSAISDGKDPNFVGNLKRRLNSLKGNLVEYLVGGVSVSDRDSIRDLVEDAVLNCRSAAAHGVGYGANFEALRACDNILKSDERPDSFKEFNMYVGVLYEAYYKISTMLYNTVYHDTDKAEEAVRRSLEKESPLNLRNMEYDNGVLTSIKSDIITLDTLSKILSLIITSNQAILQNPMVNSYYSDDRVKDAIYMDV